MRQLFIRDQQTQKLTTIGHRTVFNNELSHTAYSAMIDNKMKKIKRFYREN